MKTPNKICLYCKKQYHVKPYLLKTSKYCSRKCKNKNNSIKIKINCLICNKEFEHISSRCNTTKYCSNKCRHISQRNKGNHTYTCQHCLKQFNDSISKKRKYCSRSCVNKENFKTFKPKYTTVRKSMIARNMIKECEKCGYKEEPIILGVHHIDKNRNNNDSSNLQILCPNCHSIEHMKHISH